MAIVEKRSLFANPATSLGLDSFGQWALHPSTVTCVMHDFEGVFSDDFLSDTEFNFDPNSIESNYTLVYTVSIEGINIFHGAGSIPPSPTDVDREKQLKIHALRSAIAELVSRHGVEEFKRAEEAVLSLPPLPNKEIEAWKPKKGRASTEDAPAFVGRVYQPWVGAGCLSREYLNSLSPLLNNAYGTAISRNPDRDLLLPIATKAETKSAVKDVPTSVTIVHIPVSQLTPEQAETRRRKGAERQLRWRQNRKNFDISKL